MSLSTPANRRGLRLIFLAAIGLAGAIFGESGAGSPRKPAGAPMGSVRPADRPTGTVRDEHVPHGETVSVQGSTRTRRIEGSAGTTGEPEPYFSITWTATATGFSDVTHPNGSRVVMNRRIVASGSTIVRRFPPFFLLVQDSFSPDFTVTDEYEQIGTGPCLDGGAYRVEDREFITDPYRHQGTSPTFGPIDPQQREDGSWYLPDPFGQVFQDHLFNYRFENDFTYCNGTTESRSSDGEGSYWELVGTPGDIEGDPQGVTFRKQISYDLPPFHVVWTVVARRLQGDDLTVDRLEVTQGLQGADNGIPLVNGRRTVVRAYLGIGGRPGPVPSVGGILRGFAGATPLGSTHPFNPGLEIDAPASPNWKNINDTLNFEVPFPWTFEPSLRLEVEVNPEVSPGRRLVFEDDYTNNKLEESVTMTDCRPLNIGYLPIHYDPPQGHTPSDPSQRIHLAKKFLQKVFPVSDRDLHYAMETGFTFRTDLSAELGQLVLLHVLEQRLLTTSAPRPERLVGWLPADAATGAWGLSHLPGTASWCQDQPGYVGTLIAHELSHTYGDDHPPDLTTGGSHWFDVGQRRIQPPRSGGQDLFDFLQTEATLEAETWASAQNYVSLFTKFCGGGVQSLEAQAATVGDNLLIGGFVGFGAPPTGSLDPLFWTSTAPTHIPDPPSAGPGYCVQLKNGAGTLLAQYCFDVRVPAEPPGRAAATRGPFALVVPYPAGLARVELTKGTSTLLAFRTASANPPSVTLTFPTAPGLTLSGVQNVTWTANDPDGNLLTYGLLYSDDNGTSWKGLDFGLTTTSHLVDFSQLPGGPTARIRVQASDGFHTAQDDSDNPFAVGNKGPVVAIVSPPTGQTFNAGLPVVLQGSGSDLEDGSLGNAALSWSSSRDGALGTGKLIEATLSTGSHVITLTATDANGLTATDTVSLTVVPIGPPPAAPGFYTVTPCRVADTRDPAGAWGGPALSAGVPRTFSIAEQCGISATAKAVSFNFTVTQSATSGHITVYPAGSIPPLVSVMNYAAGQTRANNAIVGLSAGGAMTVVSGQPSGTVHFLIDVNGYFE